MPLHKKKLWNPCNPLVSVGWPESGPRHRTRGKNKLTKNDFSRSYSYCLVFSSFWTTQKAKAMICQRLGDLSRVWFVEIAGACVLEDGNKPTWLVMHLKFILPQLTSKHWQSIILRFCTNTTIQTFYNLHKIQKFIFRFLVTFKMSNLRFTNIY